jgi:hypothetical protein
MTGIPNNFLDKEKGETKNLQRKQQNNKRIMNVMVMVMMMMMMMTLELS